MYLSSLPSRAWGVLRWLLAFPPRRPLPNTRMTAQVVATLVASAVEGKKLPVGFMSPQVREIHGRLIWCVDSATVGSGWRVEVDDETGTVGPLTWWGMR